MKAEYIDHMGNDGSIVRAARVSFASDVEAPRGDIKDTKLIKYLAKHNHWTPFAHTSITLRMVAPIPIRTQCFKHKFGFVENEESRRYVSYTPEYFLPTFRTQADNKKQGSGGEIHQDLQPYWQQAYKDQVHDAVCLYEAMVKGGIAEEQARFILPQGCMVNWYWTGSLSAFARFYKQRTAPHAQLEIQELAKVVGKIIQPLYPISWAALIGEELC